MSTSTTLRIRRQRSADALEAAGSASSDIATSAEQELQQRDREAARRAADALHAAAALPADCTASSSLGGDATPLAAVTGASTGGATSQSDADSTQSILQLVSADLAGAGCRVTLEQRPHVTALVSESPDGSLLLATEVGDRLDLEVANVEGDACVALVSQVQEIANRNGLEVEVEDEHRHDDPGGNLLAPVAFANAAVAPAVSLADHAERTNASPTEGWARSAGRSRAGRRRQRT